MIRPKEGQVPINAVLGQVKIRSKPHVRLSGWSQWVSGLFLIHFMKSVTSSDRPTSREITATSRAARNCAGSEKATEPNSYPNADFLTSVINRIDRSRMAGQPLGRWLLDKPHSCIRAVLLPRGEIAPAARRRSRWALTLAEREDISRGIASGCSIREIPRGLDRAASSVCREVARQGGRPAYRDHDANQQAWVSALRPKRCLLGVNHKLRDTVASKLILDWSPEQISGWLKNQYPNDESLRVSHETIYLSLFIQARGALKKEK
jgi:hypothetical protein